MTYIGARTALYVYDNRNYDKTVHYYVAEYLSDKKPMDAEHDGLIWVDEQTAIDYLNQGHKQESLFIQRANSYLV